MELSNFVFRVAEDKPDCDHILDAIYRLRYQVYINEWGFEKPEHHSEGLEKDDFDRYSRHIYVYKGSEENIIGTARIILPSNLLFPLQQYFEIDDSVFTHPDYKVAEISRLAISKDFRRRTIDRVIFNKDEIPAAELEQYQESMTTVKNERRKFEHELVRGIYIMIYRESIKLKLTHWCAVMAKGLYVILNRWRIPFTQIGPEKDYHGIRAPYVLSLKELEASLLKKNPDLLKQARQGFVLT